MKYLIVYANPNPKSFCHAIVETLVETFTEEDKDVIVRDLYEEKFEPVLNIMDCIAVSKNDYQADVKKEHEYIQESAMIILVYPIWWMGPPAIMKGYFDRIFTNGFAYMADENGLERGFVGKKVAVINTLGVKNEYYESKGMLESIKNLMSIGIFEYTGLEVVDYKFYGGLSSMSEEECLKILDDIRDFAKELVSSSTKHRALVW
jgi:NAD(P)H dehydrogenase (quinone)